jgi:hypothetical protein
MSSATIRSTDPSLHQCIQRLSLDEFHRVKIRVSASTQMKHRGHVPMPEPRGATRLAEKALGCGGIGQIGGADDLERHVAPQIGVEGLVGNAHGPAAQFHGGTVFVLQKLIMLKFFRLRHRI